MRFVLALIVLVGWCFPSLGGQGTIPTPEERAAMREQILPRVMPELGFGPLALQIPGQEEVYPDIRGDVLHRYMSDVVEFSRQSKRDGVKLWGRVCGTKYERATAEYVKDAFEKAGLEDVRIETFPYDPSIIKAEWNPTDWELTLVGGSSPAAPADDYVFTSAMPAKCAGPTAENGIEAEVVYVGLGEPADLLDRDLDGKIVLIHSVPTSSCFSHTAQKVVVDIAGREGVRGIVSMIDLPGNLQTMANDCGVEQLPCFTLGGDDSAYLKEVVARSGAGAAPRLRAKLAVGRRTGWLAQNVVGVLPGVSKEEYVLLFAHTDGWFDAAMDNASGVAALIALAEHYARVPQSERKRTMVFVGTAGHHAGSPGTKYLAAQYGDMLANTVVALNLEHIASMFAYRYRDFLLTCDTEHPRELSVTSRSPLLLKLCREAVQRYGIVIFDRSRQDYAGDAGPLRRLAVPTISLIEGGTWYHTIADTPEHVSPEGLERAARMFAYVLDGVNGATRADLEKGAKPNAGRKRSP